MTQPRSAWLPAELTTEQPYSMCPVLRWRCEMVLPSGRVPLTQPSIGGSQPMDAPIDVHVRGMWWAPKDVQRAAQKLGLPAQRIRVPGLAEAFERAREAKKVAHV